LVWSIERCRRLRGVVDAASLAVLLLDSCWGREAGGDEDLRKWALPETGRSLSDDVETMERGREVDLESWDVSDRLSFRFAAEYCKAALVLSWMFTALLWCPTSRDIRFIRPTPADGTSDEAASGVGMQLLCPIAPADMERFGALSGRLLLRGPVATLSLSSSSMLSTPGENPLSLWGPVAEVTACSGEVEGRGEPVELI
jgi:hypothetical protein